MRKTKNATREKIKALISNETNQLICNIGIKINKGDTITLYAGADTETVIVQVIEITKINDKEKSLKVTVTKIEEPNKTKDGRAKKSAPSFSSGEENWAPFGTGAGKPWSHTDDD
ncbi:MAG: hypothetical protein WCT18_00830 [Patescibacteria group bacterium]